MQTIWKLLRSIIVLLLKAQKYKTTTLPILPVSQIECKDRNEANHRCERLMPQLHLHYKIIPSPALPQSCFSKTSPLQPGCSPDIPQATVQSIQLLRSHTKSLSYMHSDLRLVPLKWPFPLSRVPACSHLLPKWLQISSVPNFASALLVMLLRSTQ